MQRGPLVSRQLGVAAGFQQGRGWVSVPFLQWLKQAYLAWDARQLQLTIQTVAEPRMV
jgi:hypothetical protein